MPNRLSAKTNPRRTVFELHNTDCVAGMAALPPASVDVVVTSPPYNLGLKYGRYNDATTRQKYLDWSLTWVTAVKRVLKPDGSFFLNVGASPSNPLLPHQLGLLISELFVLQNTFHWIKSISLSTKKNGAISAGHFKPLNSQRYITDCHEYIFHFTPSGMVKLDRLAVGVEYADKSNIARWNHTQGRDRRCRGNNWFIPYETIRSRARQRPHPATFPVALPEQCIRVHGPTTETVVLDPFLGIGHSALAARNCGVNKFIGFEIEADYLAVAREQLIADAPEFFQLRPD